MKRIVFTGGHHTSALVIAKALQKKGYEIVWFGHKYTMRQVKNISLEYRQVRKAGIDFVELKTGKIHQGGISGWPQTLQGFFQALRHLRRQRPAVIISFGGYLAVPVVLAGWWLRIPAVTHEQTVTAGLANRFLKHFVQKIFLTWPESTRFFPARKSQVIGLPLRPEILTPMRKRWFGKGKPMILITGGKQGAQAINRVVFQALPALLTKFQILHQTGKTSTTGDWQKAREIRAKLPPTERQRYRPVAYLTDQGMGAALDQAVCVVGRAGAHTVYELLFLGKPAVLIPLPFSFAQEQRANAQKVVAAGFGEIIDQQELTASKLVEAVKREAKTRGKKQDLPRDAAEKMVRVIEQLVR